MTDEELLAKVAKIEGYKISEYGLVKEGDERYMLVIVDGGYERWNPLTNKAQAFELAESHKLTMIWWDDGSSIKEEIRNTWGVETTQEGEGKKYACVHDPLLFRAILLAIVAANE